MLHCARVLNNVVITTVIEMVEMVQILDGRVGKRSVERVRYVINTLSHCEIWSHFTRTLYFHSPSLVTILALLVKYVVIFHADPCNKSS